MFAFAPQIFKVCRSKSTKDISKATLLQLALGVALWIAYGIHQKDRIIIVANAVTLFSLAVLLSFCAAYKNNRC